jgi:hypothetical protein
MFNSKVWLILDDNTAGQSRQAELAGFVSPISATTIDRQDAKGSAPGVIPASAGSRTPDTKCLDIMADRCGWGTLSGFPDRYLDSNRITQRVFLMIPANLLDFIIPGMNFEITPRWWRTFT